MDRAYALLNVKTIDETASEWVIKGVASTPTADRMGDSVDPMGAKFALPMPLLWQHDATKPVGRVEFATPTKKGIPFTAHLPKVTEPGVLKDRVDEAVQSVKHRLVSAVSIGFRILNDSVERMKDAGGYLIKEWEWLELSLVTIPANAEATITSIKSLDRSLLAASGQRQGASQSPGASGTAAHRSNTSTEARKAQGNTMKTMQELRDERVIKAARMAELNDIGELGDDESSEFDNLESDIKSIDTDMRKMRVDALKSSTGTPVTGQRSNEGSRSRSPNIIVRNTDPEDKFKGQSFIRKLKAQGAAFIAQKEGQHLTASAFAAQMWGKTNPQLVSVLKANEVAGGGTGSGEWGAELVGIDNRYMGDFIEYLYSKTVFDRLGLRAAPKNVSVKGMDGAATGYWVGESKGIPVSKPDFSSTDLTTLKAAGICVASKELLADSDPAAEMLIRDALVEAIAQRIDTTFLSATAASAGVSPAGILNGVSALTTTGTDEAAVRTMVKALTAQFNADKNAGGLKFVMTPAMSMAIGMIVNALGQTSFPGLTIDGGTLFGIPVITGDNLGGNDIILLKPRDIWVIGDEGVQVSMSDSAMLEQNSAPTGATDTPVAASVTMVSMFQEDSVAIKVVRRTSFKKRRANAVQWVTDADFDGTAS